ncbi:hypothetical protein FB565_000051 [Actinoplanes lutulentus]|uniref:Uncharacterized protein n=1 Tax=Actinoplanes lutulentus TaxID=1287878 RepID=A0A327Z253_9ACTN|nr:hypothetical protein [Actinoplanes lutulentus]MBB2940347.1 hypothetical protein [Actinoplanes lutulentus]RAK28840.1 hypothetical protein B0I29_119178 [Actinoplanes lutulentus]
MDEEALIEPHPEVVRLAEALGLPKPGPWTREQVAEFREKQARAARDLAEIIAHRSQRSA